MLRFIALWLLVRVFGRLPASVLYVAADSVGTLVWYAAPRLRRTTRDHMRHAIDGDPRTVERAARGCVRNAAHYYADFARASHLSPAAAFAEIEEFEGVDRFFEAYDRGCGVVLVSAHLGNPEYLFRAASFLGFEMLVLTEPLSPPRVHELVHAVRNVPGVRFTAADMRGAREALTTLRAGGVAAVLGDRDIQRNGRSVPFFGERTTLPTGPVELALRTNATLMPVFGLRSGRGRYRIVFCPPLELQRTDDREADVQAAMQALVGALEDGIRRAPEQWFVLQPIWAGLPRPTGGMRTMSSDEPGDQHDTG